MATDKGIGVGSVVKFDSQLTSFVTLCVAPLSSCASPVSQSSVRAPSLVHMSCGSGPSGSVSDEETSAWFARAVVERRFGSRGQSAAQCPVPLQWKECLNFGIE